jgi:hypothetical protein
MTMTNEELNQLGHGIAYDAACSLIESNCLSAPCGIAEGWFDVREAAVNVLARGEVAEAVVYLDMRGLIERHPDNPDWVALRDETEADPQVDDEGRKLLSAAYHALRSYQHGNTAPALGRGIADSIGKYLGYPWGKRPVSEGEAQ